MRNSFIDCRPLFPGFVENSYYRDAIFRKLMEDMVSALLSTEDLFGKLASQTAEMKGYKYPKEAENYAKLLLAGYMVKI